MSQTCTRPGAVFAAFCEKSITGLKFAKPDNTEHVVIFSRIFTLCKLSSRSCVQSNDHVDVEWSWPVRPLLCAPISQPDDYTMAVRSVYVFCAFSTAGHAVRSAVATTDAKVIVRLDKDMLIDFQPPSSLGGSSS